MEIHQDWYRQLFSRPHRYWEYLSSVETANLQFQEELAMAISEYDPMEGGTRRAAVVVGSDGKMERHAQSKHEIVLIADRPYDYGYIAGLQQHLLRHRFHIPFEWGYNVPIESKHLDQAAPFSFVEDTRSLVYPDRILNARVVVGDPSIYTEARVRCLVEMAGLHPESKHIQKEIKNQVKGAVKVMKSGFSRDTLQFSEATGEQFYDESVKPGMFGFKTGPMRLAQRKLDLLTAGLMQHSSPDEIGRYAIELPTNTCERLDYFGRIGFINVGLADRVSQAYTWFMLQYHLAQEIYKSSGIMAVVPFDQSQFRMYSQQLLEFETLRV